MIPGRLPPVGNLARKQKYGLPAERKQEAGGFNQQFVDKTDESPRQIRAAEVQKRDRSETTKSAESADFAKRKRIRSIPVSIIRNKNSDQNQTSAVV